VIEHSLGIITGQAINFACPLTGRTFAARLAPSAGSVDQPGRWRSKAT
jgi:hypothetical protein